MAGEETYRVCPVMLADRQLCFLKLLVLAQFAVEVMSNEDDNAYAVLNGNCLPCKSWFREMVITETTYTVHTCIPARESDSHAWQ